MPFLYRISAEDTAITRWELGNHPVLVGRQEGVTIWVPDYRVSGQHFVIRWKDGAHTIEDLCSTNGTWVNGARISKTKLREGDRIQAGKTFFSYESGLATAMQELEGNSPGEWAVTEAH